jgi:hypothetical protein
MPAHIEIRHPIHQLQQLPNFKSYMIGAKVNVIPRQSISALAGHRVFALHDVTSLWNTGQMYGGLIDAAHHVPLATSIVHGRGYLSRRPEAIPLQEQNNLFSNLAAIHRLHICQGY